MDTRLSREHITQLYNQTICSIEALSGTPYDCSQADIDAFHKFARTVRSPKFLPAEESIQTLTSFLTQQNPTPDICNALGRLRLAAWNPNWGPDVIIKALCDIDKAFFNSRLRGHVKVYWCNSSNENIRRRFPQVPRGLIGALLISGEICTLCWQMSSDSDQGQHTMRAYLVYLWVPVSQAVLYVVKIKEDRSWSPPC